MKLLVLHALQLVQLVMLLTKGSCEAGGWKEKKVVWKGKDPNARRGPVFVPGLATNVSVTAGMTAILPCAVALLRGRSVSWIRQRDLQVLTTNRATFTTDKRFRVVAPKQKPGIGGGVQGWNLHIEVATPEDAGIYECQINTRPKLSHPVYLEVEPGSAKIAGPPEVYVELGSRLLLTCWIVAPPRPPGPLTWRHNDTDLDSQTDRGGLSLHVAVEGAEASSRLSLQSVTPTDAGNYTCQPVGLDGDTVTVYVMQDKLPAAMHHDNGSATTTSPSPHPLSSLHITCLCFVWFLVR
ncbi:zwei Ig domain protein zig-8-like [Oratosquilla oratoria]|uniref:zwei Ig domain protein zig-8-like n=1 Tax=Oratosquilla oratoria TaxID=337810 RepID=UPI003F773C23